MNHPGLTCLLSPPPSTPSPPHTSGQKPLGWYAMRRFLTDIHSGRFQYSEVNADAVWASLPFHTQQFWANEEQHEPSRP